MYALIQFFIDDQIRRFYSTQQHINTYDKWVNASQTDLKKWKNDCTYNKSIAICLYIFVYVSLGIMILGSVYMLQSMIGSHQIVYHNKHKKTLILYTVQLFLSLGVKLFLVEDLLDYDSDTLPIYAVSELLIMILFSVFKKDDDWFKCY